MKFRRCENEEWLSLYEIDDDLLNDTINKYYHCEVKGNQEWFNELKDEQVKRRFLKIDKITENIKK